jgi:hypothetical protein
MSSLQASRTLVKSPPELWAELSDIGSLARHLGEFGEIRITQVDPESRVEWEADRASGTVRLEPSGWGTRVVLTVDTPEPAAAPAPAAEAEAVAEPEAVPAPEPPPVAAREAEPGAAVEEAEPVAATEPEPAPESKRGFWARLFGRKTLIPVEPEPEPVVEEPEPELEPVAEEPTDEDPAFGTIEWEVPEPVAEDPEPEPEPEPLDAHAVLNGVLDTLGAAHHRPFSRS